MFVVLIVVLVTRVSTCNRLIGATFCKDVILQ